MIYKNGPRFKIRAVADIKNDISEARRTYGEKVRKLFFPAGNTIAMKTKDLCEICRFAKKVFPCLERITVYGSSQFIHKKGPQSLQQLAAAGLSRIHVGLESGDDAVLRAIKKGTNRQQQIEAGKWVKAAGIELSEYVILGIGGRERSKSHALETAGALNAIDPDFIRLRTFVPKINTPLLKDVQEGKFQMLGPQAILRETEQIVRKLNVSSYLTSDHYTNYINVEGKLPEAQDAILDQIRSAMTREEQSFRPFFIGTE
jgi:radical SAM superfamily enzyme YgiQ (UPF0313 family)